eukprot:m.29639 g.29639  ORF g.29639 m.29639 type:complete len:203 (+) comp6721_c0_seq2:1335-1943(+)
MVGTGTGIGTRAPRSDVSYSLTSSACKLDMAEPAAGSAAAAAHDGPAVQQQDSALGAVGLGGGQANEAMQNYQAQETLLAERLKAQKELLPKINLEDLVKQINPNQKLDGEVEELLVDMANDFVERVVTFSCQLAKHRGSDVLEVKDVQLHLERNWNIRVPGYPREDARVAKPAKPTESHKQRLGAVQKDSTSKRRKVDDGR